MDLTTIGKNIRKYRLDRNLRQEDLAEKVGLSAKYIGIIERGEKIPALETFINLLNALDVSADLILKDVISSKYVINDSLMSDKISTVSEKKKEEIYDVIETMLKYK